MVMLRHVLIPLIVLGWPWLAKAKHQLTSPEKIGAAGDAATSILTTSATFDQLLDEWKTTRQELHVLRMKQRATTEEGQLTIQKKIRQLLARLHRLAPKLSHTAEKEYLADPNANPAVTQFLLAKVASYTVSGQYEKALRLSKMLLEDSVGIPNIFLYAGISAFATNQFDEARQYFQAAGKADLFNTSPDTPSPARRQLLGLATQCAVDLASYRRLWLREQHIRDLEAKADDLPRIRLETNKGNVLLELFENEAPNTTANFIELVEDGFYDGLAFHLVLPGRRAQSGSPNDQLDGGPGYRLPNEGHLKNHRNHFRGSLSMAEGSAGDSSGSQFFIVLVPDRQLSGKRTVFGRIVDGLNVLGQLQQIRHVRPDLQAPPDKINTAIVVRKRDHAYQAKRLPTTE